MVISFTVETDGRLPSGMSLGEAIETTDAATDGYATHYMLNCAHPAHFDAVARSRRPRGSAGCAGLRANASTLSHAELDEMEVLDAGDPDDLAAAVRRAGCRAARRCTWWAGAAAPTTATSRRSRQAFGGRRPVS